MRPSARQWLWWLLGRRERYRVAGPSMQPTLRPGQTVLVDPRAYRHRPPVAGEIMVAEHPHRPGFEVVKRVHRVEGGRVVLRGDNPAATTDSRDFGPVPLSSLRGRVESSFR